MMLSSQSKMNIAPQFRPVLDPEFVPASLWNRAFASAVAESGGGEPLALSLERSDGSVSVFRTRVLPAGPGDGYNLRYAERLLKFLLWQKGGWRVTVAGPSSLAAHLRQVYSPLGARSFDYEFMG